MECVYKSTSACPSSFGVSFIGGFTLCVHVCACMFVCACMYVCTLLHMYVRLSINAEAVVLFEYESTQDDELSLQVGEVIHNVVEVSGCKLHSGTI